MDRAPTMAGYSLLFGLEDSASFQATSQTLTSSLTPGAARKFGLRAIAFLRDIWGKSLSTSFRTSGLSRRTGWHISLPILSVYNLVSDAVVGMPLSIMSGDVFMIGAFVLATWRLPVQSWWSDAIMVAAVVSCFLWSEALIHAGAVYAISTPSIQAFMTLFFIHLCGVNTFAVFAGILMCIVITLEMDPGGFGFIAASSLALAPWTVLVDSAGVMAHLAQTAVQKLLDDCNDGFFSMNLSTGKISSVSLKMMDLFSLPSDCDQPFTGSVVADDWPRFTHLLDEAKRGNLEPTFLSCRTASTEFDCKLIPYFACMDHIYLCLQVIGEVRMGMAPSPEGSRAGGDSPRDALAAGAEEGRAEERLTIRAPANDADDNGSEISFDLTSVAVPMPGERAHYARSLLSYSASSVSTQPRHQVQVATQTLSADTVSAATQTISVEASGHPPLPSGFPRPEEGGACAGKRPPLRRARKSRVHVQLCSSRRVLPEFVVTSGDTIRLQLCEMLLRFNTTGSGCCTFHIIVARLQSVLRNIHDRPCRPNFIPFQEWQCAQCLSMNSREDCGDDGELVCAICSAEEPIFPGAAPGDSTADAVSGNDARVPAPAADASSG